MQSLKNLINHAEEVIRSQPGLTRMEWFNACCEADQHRNTNWHVFKFQVALQLILGGRVKSSSPSGDNGFAQFFHISHNS